MADVSLSAQPATTADLSADGQQPWAISGQAVFAAGRQTKALDPPPTKPSRRRFTAEYKLRVLHEADQCAKPGELGALLRREGLYSSHLCAWRRQREAGARAALAPKKRGRKPAKRASLARENQSLQRENQHLRARLRQAELIIAMQARVSDILGIPQAAADAPAVQSVGTKTALLPDRPQPSGNHRGWNI